jgi:hypothetical protein
MSTHGSAFSEYGLINSFRINLGNKSEGEKLVKAMAKTKRTTCQVFKGLS